MNIESQFKSQSVSQSRGCLITLTAFQKQVMVSKSNSDVKNLPYFHIGQQSISKLLS